MKKVIKKSVNQDNRSQENAPLNFLNPYNFIPVNDNYCEVDWANDISHDIPFSDGVSGKIIVKFKAESPIIVKEGGFSSFVSFQGKPFIPGTSLKGMIRNNLEILSLSKISSLTKDSRYSMRDLSPFNKDYTIKQNLKNIKAGFIVSIKGQYHLIECPEYERLSYEDLQDLVDENDIGKRIKNADSVARKYKLIEEKPIYANEENSNWAMVLTGKMFNKKAEYGFKFPEKIKPTKLPEKVVKDFRFIYEKETDSATWKYWKKKIHDFNSVPTVADLIKDICWVPVFYMKNETEILHMGLTFLYREPFSNSIHKLIPEKHLSEGKSDFAEALFGSSNTNSGIKGRVAFSHAFFDSYEEDTEKEIVLGSPKPTFFPFYIKQDKNQPYSTFSNSNATINGWKRYLTHNETNNQNFTNDNINVRTKMKPIKSGAILSATIRFHNLRRIELGALISALTFHNNHSKCFHLIGMGKPLGYGKLKIIDINLYNSDHGNLIEYMSEFEKYMCDKMFNRNFDQWKNSISKLFIFSADKNNEKVIRYPKAFNEFKNIKNKKLNIVDFSPVGKTFELESLSIIH